MFDTRIPLIAAATLAVSASAAPLAQAGHKAKAAQADDCTAADVRPTQASDVQVRAATLCLLNIERRAEGRGPLRQNTTLRNVANRYAGELVGESFFDHVSPSGSTMTTRIKKSSYLKGARSWSIGENLAWGTGDLATPRETVQAWMNSSGHRANILNPKFRDIGIGVASGTPRSADDDGATYTTDFGRKS